MGKAKLWHPYRDCVLAGLSSLILGLGWVIKGPEYISGTEYVLASAVVYAVLYLRLRKDLISYCEEFGFPARETAVRAWLMPVFTLPWLASSGLMLMCGIAYAGDVAMKEVPSVFLIAVLLIPLGAALVWFAERMHYFCPR